MSATIERRALLAGVATSWVAGSAGAAAQRLVFDVFRNGARIGRHEMVFASSGSVRTATTNVGMTVKVGPVAVFRYRHQAVERWIGARWSSLETQTVQNGKRLAVSARPAQGAVLIEGPRGLVRAPADAAPLTHWNPASFGGPLFNPQDGKLLRVRVQRLAADHWAIRGDAEIDNYYDADGVWRALKGRLDDGSRLEYRRI